MKIHFTWIVKHLVFFTLGQDIRRNACLPILHSRESWHVIWWFLPKIVKRKLSLASVRWMTRQLTACCTWTFKITSTFKITIKSVSLSVAFQAFANYNVFCSCSFIPLKVCSSGNSSSPHLWVVDITVPTFQHFSSLASSLNGVTRREVDGEGESCSFQEWMWN